MWGIGLGDPEFKNGRSRSLLRRCLPGRGRVLPRPRPCTSETFDVSGLTSGAPPVTNMAGGCNMPRDDQLKFRRQRRLHPRRLPHGQRGGAPIQGRRGTRHQTTGPPTKAEPRTSNRTAAPSSAGRTSKANRHRSAQTPGVTDPEAAYIQVPARIASSARRIRLHLPESWLWQAPWEQLSAKLAPPQTR